MEINSSSLRSYYPYWNRRKIPANGRCYQSSRQRNQETSYCVLSLRMGLGTLVLLVTSNFKCSLLHRVKSGCKLKRNTNWQCQRKLIHGKKNSWGAELGQSWRVLKMFQLSPPRLTTFRLREISLRNGSPWLSSSTCEQFLSMIG